MEYKNSRRTIIFPILLAVAMILGIAIGLSITRKIEQGDIELSRLLTPSFPTTKLGTILSLIDSKYVDTVPIDSITEEFIPQILSKLDPHSIYMPAKEAKESMESLAGEFDGIGVVFNMATDTVIIQNVVSGGPSEKVGIMSGDRIITINDSIVAGKNINQNDIVKMLKGVGGTTVRLGIERAGAQSLLPFEVVRGKIPVQSIDAAFMIQPGIGYIKLLQFSRNSHEEFVNAVMQLKEQGMEHLIFDLTANSGGFLDQAILIANEFLPQNALIVYTEGRATRTAQTYADGTGRLIGQDMVLLIDEGSASSSEIVAGAFQDNDIGLIIGRRSFGKGLVQQQIPFNDGSLMNLTIARYHTPTGRSIQRPYNDPEAYNNDLLNRLLHSELISADSIKLSDSLKYVTPKGKIVYGGGGIMPDVFVPMDTTALDKHVTSVMANNILFNFTLKYTDEHRTELQQIKTMDDIKAFFEQNEEQMYNEFVHYAASKGASIAGADKSSQDFMKYFIKGYIARNTVLQDNGFYYFMYPVYNIVTKAVEILETAPDQRAIFLTTIKGNESPKVTDGTTPEKAVDKKTN